MLPWSVKGTGTHSSCAVTTDKFCGVIDPGCRLPDDFVARGMRGNADVEKSPDPPKAPKSQKNGGARESGLKTPHIIGISILCTLIFVCLSTLILCYLILPWYVSSSLTSASLSYPLCLQLLTYVLLVFLPCLCLCRLRGDLDESDTARGNRAPRITIAKWNRS